MSEYTPTARSDSIEPAPNRFDPVTIGFHWLTAALVVLLFGTSLLWQNAPRELHWGKSLQAVHVSLGILFAAVIVGRILWRVLRGRHLPPATDGVAGLAAQTVHAVLYMLVSLQVVLGFTLRWLQGEAFSFFGLFTVPSLIGSDRVLSQTAESLHNFVGWTIVCVAGGHAVAALIHHFALRDRVLGRMVPALGD